MARTASSKVILPGSAASATSPPTANAGAYPTPIPPCDRGEQGRARAWVARYLDIPEPHVDYEIATRTHRLGDRLDNLGARMAWSPLTRLA
jgi:hypothetical protein